MPLGRNFFTKTGEQLSCDYIRYNIHFGIEARGGFFDSPVVATLLENLRFDFSDQVPPNTHAVNAELSGDVTGPGGPVVEIAEVADVDDTVNIANFRLSAADLDGLGRTGMPRNAPRIIARIDRAAFPAPTMTVNQAGITATLGDMSKIFVSHDPALPDDGDPETGEKTKVLVDLTGCDETPPGGAPPEPCFKLVQGEVLCDPAGLGDFIYKMPVGAEMAGQTVQLVTMTPGVTITPAEQVVPAGGGVLEWTISGASPGDTIELMVTGVKQVGGPVEGVGICCTQRITIVIPPDLDCPAATRAGHQGRQARRTLVCTRGGPCTFTIRVANAGTAPYNGPIVLEDVTGPGNATLIAGPNAPWICAPGVSPIVCSHPPLTLNPGQFVDLKLGFQPGPGWNWDVIRNCAEYDYTASGFPHPFGLQNNDKSCASIPICRRGDPRCPDNDKPRADLEIKKIPASEYCTPAGLCGFLVGIRNVGANPYVGPLTFRDRVTPPAPLSMAFAPTPPWVCNVIDPTTYQCDHPSVNLAPGGFTVVAVRVSAPNYPKDTMENCVKLNQVPNEANLANNGPCATIKIRKREQGNPDLGLTKVCSPSRIAGAAQQGVICRITVNNSGTGAPAGTVRVSDAAEMIGGGAPVQITAVQPDGPQWTCSPTPTNSLICDLPGSELQPGTSRHFDVLVPDTNGEPARNCARGGVGGGDAFAPFGEACDEFGGHLRVQKTGDLSCQAGGICTFEITITNGTGGEINGPVHIVDAMTINGAPSNAAIAEINPPLGCAPEPTALPVNCVANMTLAPGESRVHQIAIQLPDNAGNGENANGRNCVAAQPGLPNGIARSVPQAAVVAPPELPPNADCHEFRIAAQQKTCTPPLVLNADDRCVCPEGTKFQNGTCVPITVNPKACPIPGQIVVQGDCVCPEGMKVIGGRCKYPITSCQVPGQIVVNDKCQCPEGQKVINGKCRVPQQGCKIPGQIVVNGDCVCPKGQQVINGRCRVPPVICSIPGQIVVNGECVCPKGTGDQRRLSQAETGLHHPRPDRRQRRLRLPEGYGGDQRRLPQAAADVPHRRPDRRQWRLRLPEGYDRDRRGLPQAAADLQYPRPDRGRTAIASARRGRR
ncbi:MAG: hypothetical protein IPL47_09360 [Phyllobacteriaceae bacterium]|nr:hypothetical protein [Phyllobacteriaceae bacterium]